MTKEERIAQLEQQIGTLTNEPNQAEIDAQQAAILRQGAKSNA